MARELNGLIVLDDFTPRREHDSARAAIFTHPDLMAVELHVTPEMATFVATRVTAAA